MRDVLIELQRPLKTPAATLQSTSNPASPIESLSDGLNPPNKETVSSWALTARPVLVASTRNPASARPPTRAVDAMSTITASSRRLPLVSELRVLTIDGFAPSPAPWLTIASQTLKTTCSLSVVLTALLGLPCRASKHASVRRGDSGAGATACFGGISSLPRPAATGSNAPSRVRHRHFIAVHPFCRRSEKNASAGALSRSAAAPFSQASQPFSIHPWDGQK